MIKKTFIAFLESDIKMLVFVIAIICLLFNQNNLVDPIEEFEIENALTEDFDTESEEKSGSEKFMEDAFFDLHFSTQKWFFGNFTSVSNHFDVAVIHKGHLIEIPIPPPEFL